jgi:antirestriction factor ArdC-like protein
MESSELLQRLQEGIASLTTSEAWTRWLDVQRKFHKYSFGNALLICLQRPDASLVAGYRGWPNLGRRVRSGEKGIAIMAPMVRRVRVEDKESDTVTVVTRSPRAFKVVYVFDVAQTDGDELAQMPISPLAGDDPGRVFLRLLKVAVAIGYSVELTEFADQRNGDCTYSERRIRVLQGLAPAMACKTLSHELAHALLHGHGFKGTREQAELEAESTAYLVTADLGIDSSAYSFAYVASWAGGGPEAIRRIAKCGHRIVAATRAILDGPDELQRLESA